MDSEPLFSMEHVSKSFGATRALDRVSFAVRPGEVRALIGENGAGKSTLLGVLAAVHAPDAGSMRLAGAPFAPSGPAAARRAGVAMIHQELAIAPHLSVAENVTLGDEDARWGFVDRARTRTRAREALARLTAQEIDVDRKAGGLPLYQLQWIEIARALAMEARVIVLDEPTSSLGKAEAERLHAVIRELAARGLAIVVVTHFLDELPAFADTFTVLRDGAVVLEGRVGGTSNAALVEAMVGRPLEELFPAVPHAPGEVLLEVRGLSGASSPRGVDLAVRRGEVLGLAGLLGSGRSELVRCIYGLDPVREGTVRVAGNLLPAGDPRAAIARGLALLSEDRKGEGLALDQSIEDNLTLSRLGPFAREGWLSLAKRRRVALDALGRVRCKADPRARASSLSGGNQQKIAFARLLHQDADVFLLDEPTRGIDVATKAEMHRAIEELAARGKAVVVVSSQMPELLRVADTIAVFRRGELCALAPREQWDEGRLLLAASGATS